MSILFPRWNGAKLDSKRIHRYYLYRIWNKYLPQLAFIGLNPSTANEDRNDPTINKIINITHHNRYGGFYMFNLFTIISPDPKVLHKDVDDFEYNLSIIKNFTQHLKMKIVFCWGNFETHGRDKIIQELFKDVYALKINRNGSPAHPLYLPSVTKLISYIDNQ